MIKLPLFEGENIDFPFVFNKSVNKLCYILEGEIVYIVITYVFPEIPPYLITKMNTDFT